MRRDAGGDALCGEGYVVSLNFPDGPQRMPACWVAIDLNGGIDAMCRAAVCRGEVVAIDRKPDDCASDL